MVTRTISAPARWISLMGSRSDTLCALPFQKTKAHYVADMTGQRATRGRPSKGPRDTLLSRVPVPLGDVVRDRAAERGMTVSDYVAAVMALNVGMPDVASLRPVQSPHSELPIADIA